MKKSNKKLRTPKGRWDFPIYARPKTTEEEEYKMAMTMDLHKAIIIGDILCGECNRLMIYRFRCAGPEEGKPIFTYCRNPACSHHEIKYHAPVVILEEVNEKI